MSEKKSTSTNKFRNYACVIYPDSVDPNWKEIITQSHIPCFVSPLHDKDKNADGEPKKPHQHVILMYQSPHKPEQAKSIFESFGGVGCEIVKELRGYARYLCHLDNPEKERYSENDVLSFNGCDYSEVIALTSDKYVALGEMQDFCDKYNIVSFYVLAKYARSQRHDWYRILCDCGTVYMTQFLQSRKWSVDNGEVAIVDPVTGEILEF